MDLDNAPAPPNDLPPTGEMPPMGGEDQALDAGAMSDGDTGMGAPTGGEDDELTQIINGLSIEDKAAVMKYAKSMSKNEGGNANMPMEGMISKKTIREGMMGDVTEPVRKRKTERDEKKLSKKAKKSSPFVSPY